MRKFYLSLLACLFIAFNASSQISLYGFTATTGTFTPITGTTPTLTDDGFNPVADEGWSNNIPIGFTFVYDGVNYTTTNISTNGVITFGTLVSSLLTNNLATGSSRPHIAPLWDDINLQLTSNLQYTTTGTPGNRVFTVQWKDARWNWQATAPAVSFQVKLYETTNVIEFIYDNLGGATNLPSASIGISGSATGAGNYLSLNNSGASPTPSSTTETTNINTAPATGQIYRFSPPAPCTTPTAQPTALNLSAGVISVNGSFTDASPASSNYLVVRTTTNVAPVPVDGTIYPLGNSAIGYIESNGPSTSFTSVSLTPGTQYYYWVFAYNNVACFGGPLYLTTAPLAGTVTTTSCSIAGNKTVGPTGNYPTLTAAANDLAMNGILGSIVLELQPTYTAAGETFPIVLGTIPCASATDFVTIRPAAGATGLTITSSAAATIDFDGGRHWKIDGRPGGTGTARELSIINTSTTGVAIRFRNDASNNTVTWCDVQGENTSTTSSATTPSGVIYFGGSSVLDPQGNDFNTISFCNVHGTTTATPAIAISARGENSTVESYNDGNIITDNNIYDFFRPGSLSVGLKTDAGNNAWIVTNNSFYQTASRTTTASNTHRAIWITPNTASIANTASGFVVNGNYIGGSAPLAAGTPWTMTGSFANVLNAMDISVGLGTPTNVQGNVIRNIAVSTTSGAGFLGISQANGHVNITNNTIGSQTGTDDIVITTTATGGGTVIGYRSGGGTGAQVKIMDNTIGGITTVGTGTLGVNIQGVAVVGAANITVENNIIGSPTVANSIHASAATTGNTQTVTGIIASAGTATTINNNTIANLTNGYTGTSTGQTRGIVVSSSATTITNNTMFNFSNANAGTGSGASSAIVGIAMTSTNAAGAVVAGNKMHSFTLTGSSTSAAVKITGIFFSGATTAASVIDRNLIHSFDVTAANNNAMLTGIDYATGIATISNNMIRLGIRPDGTSVTTGLVVRGISSNSSTGLNNFYHNSIYIGGTGVGTGTSNTFAFTRTSTSGTYDIRNNIFVNNRSNATTGGKHYTMLFTTNMNGVTVDHNIYRYNGTDGVFANSGAGDVATHTAGWTASDVHSYDADPLFVNATGNAASVDLHVGAGSIAEGTGTAVNVTNDYDDQTRAGLTPVDIGADAGDFGAVGVDVGVVALVTPVTGGCGSATQSVVVRVRNYSSSTINFATNNVTVNVSATGPVAYAGNVVVNTGTLAPGATLDVTLPATINTSAPGSYVFNANTTATGDANANNDAIAPTTVTISAGTGLGGTYTIGVGGDYATLTAAVAAYNAATCLSGNIVFELTDALYNTASGETFPIRINEIVNSNNYTLTIRPATGVQATISTASDSAVIKLNGADYVIIDGSNNGTNTRDLTLINGKSSSQASVVWVASVGTNGATHNTIKNLNIVGGTATLNGLTGVYGIVSSANTSMTTGGTDNDYLTVTNNAISKTNVAIAANAVVQGPQDGLVISNNVIGSDTPSDYVNGEGVYVAYANDPLISGNDIFNIITIAANTNNPAGIDINAGVVGGAIIGNSIRSVYQPNTGGWRAQGIAFTSATGTTGVLVANNFISDVKTVRYVNPSTFAGFGMYFLGGTNLKIYHNTIHQFGPVTTATNPGFSANVFINATAVTGMDFRNNILSNTQDFGAGAGVYNIFVNVTGFSFGTIDNNDYYGESTANTTYRVGYDGTTQRATLNDWRQSTSQDVNSFAMQPPFVSPTNLHIDIALGALFDNKGTPVGITTDIDGDSRNATTPDVGADEFAVVTGIDFGVKSLVLPDVKQCYSATETVTVRMRNYSANTHNFATIPVTVNVAATGANPTTFAPVVVNTGTIAPGDSLDVVVSTTYDMTALGTYTFDAYTTVAADVTAANDAMPTTSRTLNAVASGTINANQTEFCLNGTPNLTLTGANGGSIQWQQAPDPAGPWTNIGTGTTNYTPAAALTDTMYYRVVVSCNTNSDTTAVVAIEVNSPQLLTTTPGARCGPGSVTLSATGSGAATFNWYTAPTGGLPIATTATFNTPVINNTTTYYVAAGAGAGGTVSVGPANNGQTTGYTLEAGLFFDVTASAITLDGVYVYPVGTGAGTVDIALKDASGNNIQVTTVNLVGTAAPGIKTFVPLNWTINNGTGYALVMLQRTGGVANLVRDPAGNHPGFPYTLPGLVTITSGRCCPSATSTSYYYFYDWQIRVGCESPRQAVVATVTPAPTLDITNDLAVCNNAITTLQVNSTLSDFNDYQWSPATGLFTDAAATVPYTAGTNASTVYARISTPGTYEYVLTANNTTTSCQDYDTVRVTVLPASINVNPSPDELCVSGTSTITITPNPNTFGGATYQWMSSSDNNTYTNIAGATGSSYTTPNITATTFYKVEVSNSAGAVCLSAYDTIEVNSPQILTTTPAALCGPGVMTLGATASAGATINWYSAATGGALVGTGTSFTTPNLTQTATYYVAALQGGATSTVGVTLSQLTFGLCGATSATTTTGWALRFTTTTAMVINSVYVIPTAAGTVTITLHGNPSTGVLATATSQNFTTADVGTPQLVNLGFAISTPGDYQLVMAAGGSHRITTLGCGYPMSNASGSFVITGSATNTTGAISTTTYNSFFNISVTEGCESPRIPVQAQVSNNTSITVQPVNIATCAGATAQLVVKADGAQLSYQWRKNGANISGATNDTLTFSPVTVGDAGNYDVVITGLCGNATSQTVSLSVAAGNTWVGTVSSDWNTAANWCGGVPTPTSDVEIFPGTPYQPVVNANLADVRSLTIHTGASVTVMQNGTMNIHGDFINSGTFVAPNGFIFFKGTQTQNVDAMNVGTVMINNPAGVNLTGNMTINQSLVLSQGNLTLGINTLTVNGSVTGTPTSHVVTNNSGVMIARNVGVTPVTVPVGHSADSYNPVTIANGSNRDYSVRVAPGHSPAINNPGLAVDRTWYITASSTPPANVNITFQYEDAHMNTPGIATNPMEVGVYNNSVWNIVTPMPGGVTPSGTPTQRQVSVSTGQFGPMVIANIGGISWATSAPNVDPSVTSIQLLPNLVESSSILRVMSTRSSRLAMQVVDGSGRVVMILDKQVMVGQNDFPLEFSHLAAGVYYLSGQTDKGKTTVVRFVKM